MRKSEIANIIAYVRALEKDYMFKGGMSTGDDSLAAGIRIAYSRVYPKIRKIRIDLSSLEDRSSSAKIIDIILSFCVGYIFCLLTMYLFDLI